MAELLAANQITIAKVLDGEQGIPGEKGADGKSSYFHIKYSSVANPTSSSQMTETPSTYIGTYVDFTEADSTDPTKYTWSRFEGIQGEKGIPGIGQDGRTSYLHIAYATSADGSEGFSISESANKIYIGQYTDFVSTDSTDYTKYAWTKIKGETGGDGYSPTVTTGASSDGSTTVTVTNKDGSTTTTLVDGKARADIDNLEIGGRNLFLNTGEVISNANYRIAEYMPANEPLKAGETYTATICITPAENVSEIRVYFSQGYLSPFRFSISGTSKQVISKTSTMAYYDGRTPDVNPSYGYAQLFRFPNDSTVTGNTTIHWFKIEKGNRATDWTPAPEGIDEGIKNAAKVATNFIGYDSTNGLIIGNKTSGSWSGYRSQILPDSFNILDESSNVLASYGDAKIELGKKSISSIIEMCGGMARVSARYGGLTTIYSNNGGYQTTLDYDFNETVFKSKVGSNYGSYEFIYSGGVWECSYSGNNAGYVQVNLSDYGITLKTTSVNEYAGITIQYWNGSETKFINADTTKPSRKLIFEIAESGTADNADYANIEIERSKEGNVEHSKINLLTVHDGANVAGVHIDNGNIELDVSGEVLINGIPLNDYVVEQGTTDGWDYIKYASGKFITWKRVLLTFTCGTASGSVYYSDTITLNLPFTIASGGVANISLHQQCLASNVFVSTTAVSFRAIRGLNGICTDVNTHVVVHGTY